MCVFGEGGPSIKKKHMNNYIKSTNIHVEALKSRLICMVNTGKFDGKWDGIP